MGISDEILKPLNNSILFPKLEYPYPHMKVKFSASCLLKEDKFTFNKKVLSIYIVYDSDSNSNSFHPRL